MSTLYVAIEKALAVVSARNGTWTANLQLVGHQPQCLAVDPLHYEKIYCGTLDAGLWRTVDAGKFWQPVGPGISHKMVMSLAVSATRQVASGGAVFAGTEPSAIFRSDDAGNSWRELSGLRKLPSAETWSFPPRPWTSHVRWMTIDPLVAGRLFAAIEAGALVSSPDGGETWEDRKPSSPFDTHTLVMHRLAPDRLYSAAGDGFMQPGNGFAQSDDGGETWFRPDAGLDLHYLWSVATDPTDPDTLVVSAASGPRQAHDPASAESAIFRRSGTGGWTRVQSGLPNSRGSLAFVLASNESEPRTFYAGNNQGVFRSSDGGSTWRELPIPWPTGTRLGHVAALVAVRNDR